MEMSLNETWRGWTNPERYKILFAVGKYSNTLLNYNDAIHWWMEEVGTDKMEELPLTNPTEIPTTIGLYSALLTVVHRRTSNNPADGEEWNTEMTLSGCKLINKLQP